ncbi:tyrosine-protein phosphatase [Renibacterium salmoninarum]|nr:tyrosine-protein phosphatase [Renibacterium salmoninarum]
MDEETSNREMAWSGAVNARDLGGLVRVQPGRVFRSARREYLSQAGWQQMYDSGVRTIIDLRNVDEHGRRESDPTDVVEDARIRVISVPIEDQSVPEFQEIYPTHNSPECFWPTMRLWPEKLVAVYRAIAQAATEPGGVLIHCAAGRDRTGMIVMGLLQLAGVPAEQIVADYELAVRGITSYDPKFTDSPEGYDLSLEAWVIHTRQAMLASLATDDVESYLLRNKVSKGEIGSIRRLLIDA